MTIDAYPGKAYDNFMVVTSATKPALPWEGLVVYETDTKRSYIWNGASWQRIGGRPSSFLGSIEGTTAGASNARFGILNVPAQPFACRAFVRAAFLLQFSAADGSEFELSLRDGANIVDGYFNQGRYLAGPAKLQGWLMGGQDFLVPANTAKTYTLWGARLAGAATCNVPADGRYSYIIADYVPDQAF